MFTLLSFIAAFMFFAIGTAINKHTAAKNNHIGTVTHSDRTYIVTEGNPRAFSRKLVSMWDIEGKDDLTQFELYHELTHARYWHPELMVIVQAITFAVIAGTIAGEIPVIVMLGYFALGYVIRIGMEFQADYGAWKATKVSSKVIDYLALFPKEREYNNSWKVVFINGYPKFKWRKAMLDYYNSKLS